MCFSCDKVLYLIAYSIDLNTVLELLSNRMTRNTFKLTLFITYSFVKLHFHKHYNIFSSPENKVLKVSYCDWFLSVSHPSSTIDDYLLFFKIDT